MSKLTKYEILMIRACKGTFNEERKRRLCKIASREYLYDFETIGELAPVLLEIVMKVYTHDECLIKWAIGVESKGVHSNSYITDQGAEQIISKIRFIRSDEMPEEWISPIKFRRD